MFDVSFGEMALIAVVALLVVGPQKLPELARTAGVWIGKARRMIASVRADVDRELKTDELRKLLTEQKAEVEELRQIIDDSRSTVESDLEQTFSEGAVANHPAKISAPDKDTTMNIANLADKNQPTLNAPHADQPGTSASPKQPVP